MPPAAPFMLSLAVLEPNATDVWSINPCGMAIGSVSGIFERLADEFQ